ncbi:MAG: hypothetical protein HYX66_05590 [Ignavibacteria bacterium]|nr:hypothetical protein [Ignavibacteria bacterium]
MDVVILHGYSSSAKSIKQSLGNTLTKVNTKLGADGIRDLRLHYADYVSLDDQVMLEDVAESLYLELKVNGLLNGGERSLRFVVHSTGGLVVRQLMQQYSWLRLHDMIHSIVFIAPANFGSPLAHKGKSQLGRLKTMLVDGLLEGDSYVSEWQFGEVGEQILNDLELASPRQWALSDFDLFNAAEGAVYNFDLIKAWVFTGAKSESLASIVADTDGTDGVIVTSGAGLNVRRLTLDVVNPENNRDANTGWSLGIKKRDLATIPQMIINDLDHGGILTDTEVAELIIAALRIKSTTDYDTLTQRMAALERKRNINGEHRWQQFVLRVLDDRHRAVVDYDLSFNVWNKVALRRSGLAPVVGSPLFTKQITNESRNAARNKVLSQQLDSRLRSKAYKHSVSGEYRRFLVDIDELESSLGPDDILTFSLIASSGDKRISYSTKDVNDIVVHPRSSRQDPTFFMRDTTTQVDIVLDRFSEQGAIVRVR